MMWVGPHVSLLYLPKLCEASLMTSHQQPSDKLTCSFEFATELRAQPLAPKLPPPFRSAGKLTQPIATGSSFSLSKPGLFLSCPGKTPFEVAEQLRWQVGQTNARMINLSTCCWSNTMHVSTYPLVLQGSSTTERERLTEPKRVPAIGNLPFGTPALFS